MTKDRDKKRQGLFTEIIPNIGVYGGFVSKCRLKNKGVDGQSVSPFSLSQLGTESGREAKKPGSKALIKSYSIYLLFFAKLLYPNIDKRREILTESFTSYFLGKALDQGHHL